MIQSSIIELFNISQRQAASCNIMWYDFLRLWTLKIYYFFLICFFFSSKVIRIWKNLFLCMNVQLINNMLTLRALRF